MVVRSRPLLLVTASQTSSSCSGGDPADLLHQLRGVAGVVPLEHLEDTPRVLQRLVPLDLVCVQGGAVATELMAGAAVGRGSPRSPSPWPAGSGSPAPECSDCPVVGPARRVVRAGLRVVAGEHAVEVVDVDEVLADQVSPRWCRRATYSWKYFSLVRM